MLCELTFVQFAAEGFRDCESGSPADGKLSDLVIATLLLVLHDALLSCLSLACCNIDLGNIDSLCLRRSVYEFLAVNFCKPLPAEAHVRGLKLIHLFFESTWVESGRNVRVRPLVRDTELQKVVIEGASHQSIETLAKHLTGVLTLLLVVHDYSHQQVIDSLLLALVHE